MTKIVCTLWLALLAAPLSAAPETLSLSAQQHAWLAAHPVIRVGVDNARTPIESVGEDGKPGGISLEFLHRVERMLGVRFELVPIQGAANVLQALETRQVDILSATSQTDSRRRFMTLSEPFINTPIVIYTLASAPPISSLGQLSGKKVASSTRAGITELLPREWPLVEPVKAENFKIALDMLRRDQVQALVAPLLTGTHQMAAIGANDVRVSGETEYTYLVGFGVRNDWPELVPILNRALAEIPKPERDSFRQKWTVVRLEREIDYRPVWALLLAVAIAVAFIVQLRVMVRRRTAELHEEVLVRRAREAEIQQLNAALEARVEQRTAELRQANNDLRTAADQLVQTEKVASLGRLVAGIAHELNTPLGSTLTASTTLKAHLTSFGRAALEGKLKRSSVDDFVSQSGLACEIIERNAQRAAGLIDNFKELAVDQASARRRRFQVRRTVEEVLASHHNAWKASGHRIELDIDDALQMDSFPGPLAQVLSNLLENTLIHGFVGHQAGLVRIGARLHDEQHLDLRYTDDGCGIAPEHRGKIYDPFFTTRMGQGGSGLGLYIVQTMVTGVLGGQIAVESRPSQGVTFQIVLPLVAPHLTENTAAGAHGMAPLPAE
ncbi:ATP-binding protein [Duganella guangzhouensis]|nr:transporter substrate-binding domain-containing protein [Duganella guangzhouensis]